MIAIVDYGVGNLFSIRNILKKAGAESVISSDSDALLRAEKLILPGIGSFDHCMSKLKESGLQESLMQVAASQNTPILGLCVGMQIMAKSSEEGKLQGLSWIDAECVKFKFEPKSDLKIPNIGWNDVNQKKDSRLLAGMYPDARFYFVHSYHMQCGNSADVLLTSHYGYEFVCAVESGIIYGVQFHPEKSHKFGLKLFENFIKL